MLDRRDSSLRRGNYPGTTVTMGADSKVREAGLVDDGSEFDVVELAMVWVIELAHRATGSVDLDHPRPNPELPANCLMHSSTPSHTVTQPLPDATRSSRHGSGIQ